MFEKLRLLWNAFRAGESVAEDFKLHNWVALVNSLAALIAAGLLIANAFGYNLPLTEEEIHNIAAGTVTLLSLFNGGATVASSKSLGVLPAKRSDGEREPSVPTVDTATPPEQVFTDTGSTTNLTTGNTE